MRNVLIITCIIISMRAVYAQQDTASVEAIDTTSFVYGNVMYEKGQFVEAKTVYLNLIEREGPSAILYYNLGNCYYRLKDVGNSILSYERALLLEPGNDDAEYNLELANRLTRDKIEPAPASLFSIWWHGFITSANRQTWAWFAIIMMWIALMAWAAYLLPAFRQYQRIGFFTAIITCIIGIICIIGFSGRAAYDRSNTYAIVMTPSSIIKSEPSENSTNLALLHAGFKLKMLTEDTAWTEVQMPDGVVGWIRNTDFEAIDPFRSE